MSQTKPSTLHCYSILLTHKHHTSYLLLPNFKINSTVWILTERVVRIFIYEILFIYLQCPTPMLFYGRVGGWGRHNLRRLLRFGFDVLKSWKNFMRVKNKAAVDAPWVCYIQTCLIMPVSHWCILMHQWQLWGVVWCYTYRRGVRRCSFRLAGQFQEPQNVKRATVQDFTSFLCLHSLNLINY